MAEDIYNGLAVGFYSNESFDRFMKEMPGVEFVFGDTTSSASLPYSPTIITTIYYINPEGVALKSTMLSHLKLLPRRKITLFGDQFKIEKLERDIQEAAKRFQQRKGVEAKL